MNTQTMTTQLKTIAANFLSTIAVWAGFKPPGFACSSFARQWAGNAEKQRPGNSQKAVERNLSEV